MESIFEQSVAEDGQNAGTAVSVPAKKHSGIIFLSKPKIKAANNAVKIATEPDEIKELVHHIENLKKEDVIIRVSQLEDASQQTYFELGGVLSCIQKKKWYDPHSSFDTWVGHETAIGRAKAWALIAIFDALANCGVPWAKVKNLGWTKLRAIVGVLKLENADYWIGIASERSKSELTEFVRNHKADSGVSDGSEPKAIQTRIFKLCLDQAETVNMAIDRMKGDCGTEHDNVALECICMEYMSGQTLPQKLIQLQPDALAATITKVLNSLDKDTVASVLRNVFKNTSHDLTIEDD